MTPAIEYLIRTDLIKELITIPCSLFLTNSNIVITIEEEFKSSNYYSVKHWQIYQCSKEQALPFMNEFKVLKSLIFQHDGIILKGHNLLKYKQESISSYNNGRHAPMTSGLYEYYYENTTNSTFHNKTRINWLWDKFIHIYAPHLCKPSHYINTYNSDASIADKQRNLVCKYMRRQWKFWLMWQKYMLLNPGELFFYKEYLNLVN